MATPEEYINTRKGKCPNCKQGTFTHHWEDYLGWTDDWYLQCGNCCKVYRSGTDEFQVILKDQPGIVISRN